MKNEIKTESAPALAGGQWNLDTVTGIIFENGDKTSPGGMTRLIDQANSAPALLAERDRLREVLQDLVEYLDLTHLPNQDSSLGIKCDRARAALAEGGK